MSVTISNSPQSPSLSFALRATKQEVRQRPFFKGWPASASPYSTKHPAGVPHEVTHIEAFGQVYISIAHRLDGVTCESLTKAGVIHDHCTADLPGHDHRAGESSTEDAARESGAACCLIAEPFPVSMHFDMPIGYTMNLPLGDNIIVNARRADGPLEHNYSLE